MTRHILRSAPEYRAKAVPADEAIDVAKRAFTEARREQLQMLSGGLHDLLYDPKSVTYTRLLQLRHASRQQAARAQKVALLIEDAIEAFKSTEEPS